MFLGFIDFIVDPSFTVMGDMLDKIIMPLHQRNTIAEENNRADKATSTTSLISRVSTSSSRSGSLTPSGTHAHFIKKSQKR